MHVRKDKIRLNLKIHDQRWQVETKVAQNTTLWRRTPADCLIILWHMAKSDAVISFSLTFYIFLHLLFHFDSETQNTLRGDSPRSSVIAGACSECVTAVVETRQTVEWYGVGGKAYDHATA